MIAITTSNSINEKPFFLIAFCLQPKAILLYLFAGKNQG
jgi:hypothetical protein